ncbi:GPW/gp25 family protein [Helicobacter sp. 13S00477-4]|uniref:GPW/gp25 family protein n=1 Tax=Helicobacter sp. 13S00477-4 TaxID=1905759 RepID=UPI000BDA85A1|nr:GPW/gp25 family protein [Helicobacter sp. 13S00477-4]PAF50867.1 hypothetical protein BKH44_06885 [Helicobacter sp. 13S00477-4]
MKQLSIQENINRIFKTKKYTLPLNPNYGLSYEWIDKPFSKELEASMIEEIREQISIFEPRLVIESIQVSKEYSNLSIIINTNLRIAI